jgi:polysaccharide chain length determinant protein (PEP-CTERM system associated)
MSDALATPWQLADFISAIRRRAKLAAIVVGSVLLIAIGVAILWPPVYRSSGTILIEAPDIPDDLVRSTVSSFAEERLQVTYQRVMTTQNLSTIIDKFGLFAEERQRMPLTVVADQMRMAIGFAVNSVDVTDPKSGRVRPSTISFNVWYDAARPEVAQQVANELVTLYLSENLRTRQERATGSAGFLTSESQKIYEQLKQLEKKLADFKMQHAGSLPEQQEMNTQLLDRTQSQLLEVMRQMQSLRERQTYLQSQLALTSANMSVAGEGAMIINPADRLRALEAQYTSMRGEYGDKHPHVVKVLTEINALRKLVGSGRGGGATNPAYIQLQSQLKAAAADVEALQTQEKLLQERSKDLEDKIAKNPAVERDYLSLKREYDSLKLQYENVRVKGGEAQLAQSLETERMGEKFSVIEPPTLPIAPIRPNRPAILLLGIVAAIGAGIGSTILADKLGGKLYGVRQLAQTIGAEPLAVVPYVPTRIEARVDHRRLAYAAGAAAALILAIAVYVHFFGTPLNILATAAAW